MIKSLKKTFFVFYRVICIFLILYFIILIFYYFIFTFKTFNKIKKSLKIKIFFNFSTFNAFYKKRFMKFIIIIILINFQFSF